MLTAALGSRPCPPSAREPNGSVNHRSPARAGRRWRQAGQPAPAPVAPAPGTQVAQKALAGVVGFCAQINKTSKPDLSTADLFLIL